MALMRVSGMAAMDKGKQLNLIDWRPHMRIWPGDEWPLLDLMDGIEGGEWDCPEYLKSAQRYIIRLIEEGDNTETDCRIDN